MKDPKSLTPAEILIRDIRRTYFNKFVLRIALPVMAAVQIFAVAALGYQGVVTGETIWFVRMACVSAIFFLAIRMTMDWLSKEIDSLRESLISQVEALRPHCGEEKYHKLMWGINQISFKGDDK